MSSIIFIAAAESILDYGYVVKESHKKLLVVSEVIECFLTDLRSVHIKGHIPLVLIKSVWLKIKGKEQPFLRINVQMRLLKKL